MKIYRKSNAPFHEKWKPNFDDHEYNSYTVDSYNRIFHDPANQNQETKDPSLAEIIEQMFPNAIPIGSGAIGLAYDIGNDQVLKITTSGDEAVAASYLKNNPLQHMVPVVDVVFINKYDTVFDPEHKPFTTTLWGIVMQKAIPLTSYEKMIINTIMQDPAFYEDHLNNYEMDYNDNDINELTQLLIKNHSYGADAQRITYIVQQTVSLIEEIAQYHLNRGDTKGKNLGWINNVLVQFDLGGLFSDYRA